MDIAEHSMPAGALAPGAVPRRLAGFVRLPEREVGRRALPAGRRRRAPRAVRVEVHARELPVVLVGRDLEEDVAVHVVRVAALDELLGHLDDGLDVGRDLRRDVDGEDAERVHVFVERVGEARGERERVFAKLVRPRDDLVVDVGEVADVGDLVAAGLQVARDDVEADVDPRVSDVRVVIDRDAAHVEADMAGADGLERALVAAHGVEDADREAHASVVLAEECASLWRALGGASARAFVATTIGSGRL